MACLCEEVAGKDIDLSPTCIGNLWIFQNIEPEELEALSREALRKKSTTGQALFIQGDPANEMFLVKGGLVKLSKVLEDGTELTLDIRKAGDFVGENMFSEEGQYPVSAYCMEDTLTCGFSRIQN
jgi:CRP/FNR family transcriptional regulator